jgi:hypothetical protein
MFHFPAFPPHTLCIQMWVTGHDSCRVSPFGNPRITARLAAPRGLSQPPTSFIGSWCQGIHRAPLITWPQRCSRPLCSSQGTDRPTATPPRTPTRRPYGERKALTDSHRNPTPGTPEGTRRGAGEAVRDSRETLLPQDPTACLRPPDPRPPVPTTTPKSSSCTSVTAIDQPNWSAFHP